MAKEDPETLVKTEVDEVFALQKTLEETQDELMKNEQFKKFLELQKTVPEQIASIWKRVEEQMLEHNIKTIKGDWGSLTIAERTNWKIDYDLLPNKFFKKVVDTTKITDTYRLEGKAPKGADLYTTKYLTKRIK